MITAIEIENFKAIRDPQRIPLKPITLLFGPNSAGKSTLLHAIHYAQEIIERQNCDADRTSAGGDYVDLGGFAEMVHKHEVSRRIRLRFDLDLSGVRFHERFPVTRLERREVDLADLADLGRETVSGWVQLEIGLYDLDDKPHVLSYTVGLDGVELATIRYDPADAWFEVSDLNLHHPALVWQKEDIWADSAGPLDSMVPSLRSFIDRLYYESETFNVVMELDRLEREEPEEGVERYAFAHLPESQFTKESLRDVQWWGEEVQSFVIRIGKRKDTGRLDVQAVILNKETTPWKEHQRILMESFDQNGQIANKNQFDEQLRDSVARIDAIKFTQTFEQAKAVYERWIEKYQQHMLLFGSAKVPVLKNGIGAMPALDGLLELEVLWPEKDGGEWSASEVRLFTLEFLTRVIVGPLAVLRDCIKQFRYVGPIREIPPRNHVPPRHIDQSRWASGLAAWDLLAATGSEPLAKLVGDWLSNEDRLDTGYQLMIKQVREVDAAYQERMLRIEWDQEEPSAAIKELKQELERLPSYRRVYVRDIEKDTDLTPHSVGVGLSQVIPVLTAVLDEQATLVAIEQPELHLHPKQQAAIGDLLITGALGNTAKATAKRTMLIETHSEHLILRLLKRIRHTSQGHPHNDIAVRPEDVIVVYVEPENGQVAFFEIAIGSDGELLQPWPDSFFDQDYHERYG